MIPPSSRLNGENFRDVDLSLIVRAACAHVLRRRDAVHPRHEFPKISISITASRQLCASSRHPANLPIERRNPKGAKVGSPSAITLGCWIMS